MGEVSFELPWPPSVNRYYRHVGYRVLISREGRRYRTVVVSRLRGVRKLTGDLRLEAECYPPDRRRRDLDNLLKSLQDSLVHAGVMEDDSQIKELKMRMLDPVPDGMVYMQIKEINHV